MSSYFFRTLHVSGVLKGISGKLQPQFHVTTGRNITWIEVSFTSFDHLKCPSMWIQDDSSLLLQSKHTGLEQRTGRDSHIVGQPQERLVSFTQDFLNPKRKWFDLKNSFGGSQMQVLPQMPSPVSHDAISSTLPSKNDTEICCCQIDNSKPILCDILSRDQSQQRDGTGSSHGCDHSSHSKLFQRTHDQTEKILACSRLLCRSASRFSSSDCKSADPASCKTKGTFFVNTLLKFLHQKVAAFFIYICISSHDAVR